MASLVEDHPQRKQIEADILAGLSLRAIGSRVSPPVSAPTLQRYVAKFLRPALDKQRSNLIKHVTETVTQKTGIDDVEAVRNETARELAARPFLSRIERKFERYERWMEGAEKKEDWKALASLDTAETRSIELQARLSGALDSAPSTAVQVNIALCLPDPERPASNAAGQVVDVEPE